LGYIVYSAHPAEKSISSSAKSGTGKYAKTAMHGKSSTCPSSSMGEFQSGKLQIQSIRKENRIGGKYNY